MTVTQTKPRVAQLTEIEALHAVKEFFEEHAWIGGATAIDASGDPVEAGADSAIGWDVFGALDVISQSAYIPIDNIITILAASAPQDFQLPKPWHSPNITDNMARVRCINDYLVRIEDFEGLKQWLHDSFVTASCIESDAASMANTPEEFFSLHALDIAHLNDFIEAQKNLYLADLVEAHCNKEVAEAIANCPF